MARESAASASKVEDAKERNLKIALGQIEKEFGKGSIMRLGDQSHIEIPVMPSGAMALDIAMGIGGFPRGRVIEIYGPESSGRRLLRVHRYGARP